jgi:hypothetical protein
MRESEFDIFEEKKFFPDSEIQISRTFLPQKGLLLNQKYNQIAFLRLFASIHNTPFLNQGSAFCFENIKFGFPARFYP